jgi:hypothetical protein
MGVWEPHLFIVKLVPINTRASCAILVGDISSLHHKFRDHSVENLSLIAEPSLVISSTYLSEILRSVWVFVLEKLENDSTCLIFWGVLFTDSNIEIGLGVALLKLWKRRLLSHDLC